MVKESNLIIENKKPFEIVQEVNNEIPSYEEFVKSYEGDVNYDDLNGGDVGEAKGYGPCSYSNSRCTCYVSSGYVPLNLACPSGCGNKEAYVWTHSSCGGPMYISRSIRLECKRCYTSGHWKEWGFACSHHPGRYLGPTNNMAFADSLRLGLGRFAADSATGDLVKEISINLIRES